MRNVYADLRRFGVVQLFVGMKHEHTNQQINLPSQRFARLLIVIGGVE